MKTSTIFVLSFFLFSFTHAQNTTSVALDELIAVRTYVKENFEGKLWFDFNACDLNSFEIFDRNIMYQAKLSAIDTCYTETKNQEKSVLCIQTHNGAKIRIERGTIGRGINLDFHEKIRINVRVRKAKEKIETLSAMLNALVEKMN